MFVSTNRLEHANPFILIAGKDFGTQNSTQESKNMLLLFYVDWWTRFWTQDAIKEGEGKPEIWMQNRQYKSNNATQDPRFCYRDNASSQGSSKTQSLSDKTLKFTILQ